MDEKIIQIMPAPDNLYAQYKMDEGDIHESKVLCLGLLNNGDVIMLDVDGTGYIEDVTELQNFIGIKYK